MRSGPGSARSRGDVPPPVYKWGGAPPWTYPPDAPHALSAPAMSPSAKESARVAPPRIAARAACRILATPRKEVLVVRIWREFCQGAPISPVTGLDYSGNRTATHQPLDWTTQAIGQQHTPYVLEEEDYWRERERERERTGLLLGVNVPEAFLGKSPKSIPHLFRGYRSFLIG